MKNIFVSVGLVALGAAGLQTAMADNIAMPKFWSVSATLRGFYDDNYNIAGNNQGSFGVELMPSVSFHVPLQQTDFGIRYHYGLYYYEDRDSLGMNAFDQTHQVDLWLDHAFNERWHAKITDTFSAGQEPELLNFNPATATATPYRINGDNISNHGTIALNTDWTRLFSTGLTYNNNLYNYDNSGATPGALPFPWIVTPTTPFMSRIGMADWQTLNGTALGSGASLAGILDRIEQSVSLDLKWHVQPQTTVFVGYQLSWVNYTGDEPIAVVNYDGSPSSPIFVPPFYVPTSPQSFVYHSSDRDSITHYGYLGLEHQFTANLSGTVRGGASFTDNYADPLFPATSWAPYADLSLQYTYIPGSYVQVGFTHNISSTDQVTPDSSGHITQFAETSVLYFDVNHKITPDLLATVIGRLQNSSFQGGAANSASDTVYSLGINLNYRINRHFSVDAGYNYDNLVSDLPGRAYARNRVYLGLAANY